VGVQAIIIIKTKIEMKKTIYEQGTLSVTPFLFFPELDCARERMVVVVL
jgi:hypothetical protein